LALEVDGRIRSKRVIEVLARLVSEYGTPLHILRVAPILVLERSSEQPLNLVSQRQIEGARAHAQARRHRHHGQSRLTQRQGRAPPHSRRRRLPLRLAKVLKYSPDLNPIEQLFAKLKHWLRKAAKRTVEAVANAIGPILDAVSPAECTNYFVNAGYDRS
jgi:transposase